MTTGDETGLNLIQPGGFHCINISFSRVLFSPMIGDPGGALMRPLPTHSGPMRLLINYVRAVQRPDAADAPELAHLAATHIFDLAALAIGATRDATEIARARGVRAARMRMIKADVVANAGDPTLSAARIAARHGLSERYVRKLFERDDMSLSDFLLAQRLVRAHRMLRDPAKGVLNITAIAYEAGFNDLSHFNRTFRRRYRATPSDVRAQAQSEW